MTVSIADVQVPGTKQDLLKQGQEAVDKVQMQYARGLITDQERYQSVINVKR